MKKLPASTTLKEARKAGRMGDDQLVHLNKAEVEMLESMTHGHGLTINPQTGEKEAFLPFLLSMLPTLFPALGASIAGATGISALASPLVLGALGSGLGTWAETGNLGKGLMAGLGGAALGGLGGQLLGGAAGGAAGKLGELANPAMGAGAANAMGSTVKGAINAAMPKGMLSAVAGGAPGGLMSGMGGMLAPMLVGAPGAYLTAQDQMDVGETDQEKRKKASILRAQQENFMAPRTVNRAPDDYRHGIDEEFSFFSPGGTLTPVTTTRGYAAGGMVGPQVLPGMPPQPKPMGPEVLPPMPGVMGKPQGPEVLPPAPMGRPVPMAVPRALSGNTMATTQINPNVGLWGGLRMPPRQVPRPYTPPPVIDAGGGGGYGGYEGSYSPPSIPMGGGRAVGEWGRMNVQQFADGGMVMGPGDGVSDSVPAVINGAEPAALSDGEFVVPAMAVAKLGNGSSKAGAEKLQQMVDSLLAAQ